MYYYNREGTAKCVLYREAFYCVFHSEVLLYCVPQEKSAMYWPETPNNTVTAGDSLTVTLSSSTPYAEYHIRNFLLKHVCERTEYEPPLNQS